MNPPPSTAEAAKTPSQIRRMGVTPPSRRGGSGRRLDDVIVDLGFVERPDMDAAISQAERSGSSPERVLLTDSKLTDDQLSRAVAERFGLDHLDLRMYRFDPNAAKLVTPAAVKRYQAIPVNFVNDRTLLVAMADPANVLAVDDIAVMTGYEVRPAVASPGDIAYIVERLSDPDFLNGAGMDLAELEEDIDVVEPQRSAQQPAGPLYDIREQAPIAFGTGGEDSSVIQMVQRIIEDAVDRGSSDIH